MSKKTHSFLLHSVFAAQCTLFLHLPPARNITRYGNQSKGQRSSIADLYLLGSQCSYNLLLNGLLDPLFVILVHLLLPLCGLEQVHEVMGHVKRDLTTLTASRARVSGLLSMYLINQPFEVGSTSHSPDEQTHTHFIIATFAISGNKPNLVCQGTCKIQSEFPTRRKVYYA